MTSKDAIKELEFILIGHPKTSSRETAVLMAIEALKQKDEIGEWHFNSDPRCGDFVCSECLERSIVCSEYCPNCGTKMGKYKK